MILILLWLLGVPLGLIIICGSWAWAANDCHIASGGA
jgi:hypothetical protein